MKDKTARKKSGKQSQIVETAEILFKRYGIKRVTVEEICSKAMVSKMTFYKYFPNKIELVKYIWNAWFEMGWSKIDEINEMSIPFTEKLRLMIEWKMEFISEMNPEIIEEYVHVATELKVFMQENRQKSFYRFLDYFAGWQKNGDIRKEVRPEFLIAVVNKIQEMFNNDNLRKLYKDPSEFTHELHKLLFYGIVPRPGTEKQLCDPDVN